jgi:hypothetical protein
MRRPLCLVFLLIAVAMAACKSPVVCSGVVHPGIVVIVVDSISGAGLARGALVTAVDSGFIDTLSAFSDSVATSLRARPGIYRVNVSRTGYSAWSRDSVQVVRQGTCDVQTATLTARLIH